MHVFERRYYRTILVAWLILSLLLSVAGLVNSYRDLTAGLSFVTSIFLVAILTLGISLYLAAQMLIWLAIPVRICMNLVLSKRRQTHLVETLVLALIFACLVAFWYSPTRIETHINRRPALSSADHSVTES